MSRAKKAESAKPKTKRGGGRRKKAETAAEKVEVDVAVGSLLSGDNMPAQRDLKYHYENVLGLMDKARTAAGKVGDAKKKAKEAGVDVTALTDIMKELRLDPLELAARLRQKAALMAELGLPVQMTLFEPKFGSIEARAASEGWAAGKAGRSPEVKRWPENTPGHADHMRAWNDSQRDIVLAGRQQPADDFQDAEESAE